MLRRKGLLLLCSLNLAVVSCIALAYAVHAEAESLVKKEERWPVVSTDYGDIWAARLSDGINASFLLHFITLEPDSVLLPVVLNADMLFFVRAGSGKVWWTEEEELKQVEIRQGDVHRLLRGTAFYMQSEEGLKIDAIFADSSHDLRAPATGPYSSIQEMVVGFDRTILQATFKVSEEVIDELLAGGKPPLITHVVDEFTINKKKKKDKEKEKEKEKKEHKRLFNVFEADKQIENCNGWSTIATGKEVPSLEGSDIGISMVNLKAGSMMGPHWNTMDTEIIVVLRGRGVVRVSERSILVEEGDVLAVPRFEPMAQMSFNNGSFVFMGFTRVSQRSKPQFVAGESSLLQILNKQVLQLAFNVQRSTLDELLAPCEDSSVVISPCLSCAEQEMQVEEEEGEAWWRHRHGGWRERHGGYQEGDSHHYKHRGLRRILMK